jgi:hypothetical protein
MERSSDWVSRNSGRPLDIYGLAGEIGRGYRIQVATNMASTDWEDFPAFTNTFPMTEFFDISVTNFSQRFYRAASP